MKAMDGAAAGIGNRPVPYRPAAAGNPRNPRGALPPGRKTSETAVESKGLFVLDRSSGIDLSQEENLSERETYLIHVYDIIPDDAKNVDMSQFNSDYTVLLNGVNTYESSTTYGGTALNSFLLGSGYQLDREIGTVFAGDDAIRRGIGLPNQCKRCQ